MGLQERIRTHRRPEAGSAGKQTVIVKAYRRLQPGVHPEPELMGALGRAGGPVPRVFATLHFGDLVLALVMEHVEAEGGWGGPIERVAAALRGEGVEPLDEYRAAGGAARRLHALLGSLFPTRAGTADDAAAARASALSALDSVAELASLGPRVRAGLAGLARLEGAPLQRIHGDLHYAQFLRRAGLPAAPLVIDFEGDPTRPLAERRAPGSPLHDLACLLRSIDHIGSAASRRANGAAPDAWIAAARAAALEGYGPVSDAELLHALELAKEIGEFVYAQRILPEWLYAARAGLERLLA